jgi:hypothetical protein
LHTEIGVYVQVDVHVNLTHLGEHVDPIFDDIQLRVRYDGVRLVEHFAENLHVREHGSFDKHDRVLLMKVHHRFDSREQDGHLKCECVLFFILVKRLKNGRVVHRVGVPSRDVLLAYQNRRIFALHFLKEGGFTGSDVSFDRYEHFCNSRYEISSKALALGE